jgi:S1-C subfamily serine protease
VGTDAYTDLAVVELSDPPADAAPLPVATRDPVPGQPVAALGSPFGLEGSITVGVVSGVDRSMPTERGFTIPATVQTDAAVNPGNSGGPLVALDGPAARGSGEVEATVVGVNVARARAGDNVGFAISPRIVRRVVPSLIAEGKYDHSFVGIRTAPVTPAVAEANDLPDTTGVLVVDVLADGPTDGTLQPADETATIDGEEVPAGGDVIVALNGRPVRTNEDLGRILMLHTSPGDEVTFTVYRNGTRQQVTMTLAERPPS